MKHRLLIAAVFLLAGAVVNVAVAWRCAIWGPFGFKGGPSGYTISDGEVGWWLTRYDWIDASRLISRRAAVGTWTDLEAQARASRVVRLWEFPPRDASPADELIAPWGQIRESSVLCGLGEHEYLTDDARGWPLRSMWCSWGTPDLCSRLPPPPRYGPAYPSPGPLSHGIPLQTRKGSGSQPWIRAIPLAIWPPGFAVNTFFYAAVLWLLWSGPFRLRRLIRVRRGLCPKCAYPRGEADVCSECGKPLPGRMAVTT